MTTTTLSPAETAHIGNLVNLELSDTEVEKYSKELSETLEVVENLDKLDTKDVSPTYQTTGLVNRFLNEQVGERTLSPADALKNAAQPEDGLFKIPAFNYAK